MKVFALYHPVSEYARTVEDFKRDFERFSHYSMDLLSLESVEGSDKARLYDIVQYPAIVVTRDDGQILKYWSGETMPLINEISSYL